MFNRGLLGLFICTFGVLGIELAFWHGEVLAQGKQADTSVEVTWSVQIPMRDGVKLNGSIYKPKPYAEPLPAIVTLTPYVADYSHDRGVYFAKNGYVFAAVDVRGRGNSEGEFKPFEDDGPDGHDVVEWVARQSWCNGKVAMWGGSYAGFDQWSTLKELPPHLATIVPAAAVYPGVDFPACNGIFTPYVMRWLTLTSGKTDNHKLFEDSGFWNQKFRELYLDHMPFRDLDRLVGNPSPTFQKWLKHRTNETYWSVMAPTPAQYARLNVPILTITGHYDDDQLGALTYYQRHMQHGSVAGSEKHFLIIGPWNHQGTRTPKEEFAGLRFGKASLIDLNQLHKEWYDWVMKGGERPSFLKKRVAYYVAGAEEWKYSDRLDGISDKSRTLYLKPRDGSNDVFHSGTLDATKPGDLPPAKYIYDPLDRRPAELEKERAANGLTEQGGAYNLFGSGLIYHSDPLEQDTEITGIPKLTVWLNLDVPDTDFQVSLFEIKRDGSSIGLSFDQMRARYRVSLWKEQLITPGDPVRYDFESFSFISRRLSKGSRLRLTFDARNTTAVEKNYNSGGDVASESRAQARVAHVELIQNTDHSSFLQIPVVESRP